jgi:hypothetical protein
VNGELVYGQSAPEQLEKLVLQEDRAEAVNGNISLHNPLPSSVEGLVERQMFDSMCAFVSGSRTTEGGEGKPMKTKTKLKVFHHYVSSCSCFYNSISITGSLQCPP